MEDVLDVYEAPYDRRRPVVCMDESPKQLIEETRVPIPMQPGQPTRYDSEYKRNGTCTVFGFCEPKRSGRELVVTERRTMQDFAWGIKWLLDVIYPEAELVRMVLDETFEAPEARRLSKRLEFHYTPTHGSWLNMAEIEFSAMHTSCTNRRIPDVATLKRALAAFVLARNHAKATIDWRFTSIDARIKLKHLYPSISH